MQIQVTWGPVVEAQRRGHAVPHAARGRCCEWLRRARSKLRFGCARRWRACCAHACVRVERGVQSVGNLATRFLRTRERVAKQRKSVRADAMGSMCAGVQVGVQMGK